MAKIQKAMDAVKEHFTDQHFFHDSERQVRVLEQAVSTRLEAPLLYIECRAVGETFRAIRDNLLARFSGVSFSPPADEALARGSSASGQPEQRGSVEAQMRDPVNAGLFPCFYGSLEQDATGESSVAATHPAAALSDDERRAALASLIDPLTRFLFATVARGVYLTTATDEYKDSEALGSMLEAISALFLQSIPNLLFNFSTDAIDPETFWYSHQGLNLMAKSVTEALAALVACTHQHEASAGCTLDGATDSVVKLALPEHVVLAIIRFVLPAAARMLEQTCGFLLTLSIVAEARLRKLAHIKSVFDSLAAVVLFFVHELLLLTRAQADSEVVHTVDPRADVGTVRTLGRAAGPSAAGTLVHARPVETRAELFNALVTSLLQERVLSSVVSFVTPAFRSRANTLACSVLQMLPLERLSAQHYPQGRLADACKAALHDLFVLQQHGLRYKALKRDEIEFTLTLLTILARATASGEAFCQRLCESLEDGFNLVTDYLVPLLSLYGDNGFHPVRYALKYLFGPSHVAYLSDTGSHPATDTSIFAAAAAGSPMRDTAPKRALPNTILGASAKTTNRAKLAPMFSDFRTRAPEGASVNFIEYNMKILAETGARIQHQHAEVESIRQEDAHEDYDILHSRHLLSHMRNIKLWERMEQRVLRDKELRRRHLADLYTSQRKSYSVQVLSGEYEAQHAADIALHREGHNTMTILNRRVATLGETMNRTDALAGTGAHGLSTAPGADFLSTSANVQLVQFSEGTFDLSYELLYVYYSLQIMSNIFANTSLGPGRSTRAALATIDESFIRAIVYCIDMTDVLTDTSLALFYNMLVFPHAINDTLSRGLWSIAIDCGIVSKLRQITAKHSPSGLVFLTRFFSSAGWQERIQAEHIGFLASLSDSVVDMFAMMTDTEICKLCLATLAYISFAHADLIGPIQAQALAPDSLDILSATIMEIFSTHGHYNELAATILAYALFSRPRNHGAAGYALQKGIISAIVGSFVARFDVPRSEPIKLSYIDVFVVKLLTDLPACRNADVTAFLAKNASLQHCLCRIYDEWTKTLSRLTTDDEKVVLPGVERAYNRYVLAKGVIFDLTSDFLSMAQGVSRSGSPARSPARSPSPGSPQFRSPPLTVQSTNILAAQEDIALRAAGGSSRPVEYASSDAVPIVTASRQSGISMAANGLLSTDCAAFGISLNPTSGVPSQAPTRSKSPQQRAPTAAKTSTARTLSLNTAIRSTRHATPIPELGNVTVSSIGLPTEIISLLKLNITALLYSFFRAVYPDLASMSSLVRKRAKGADSLMADELRKASSRSGSRDSSRTSSGRPPSLKLGSAVPKPLGLSLGLSGLGLKMAGGSAGPRDPEVELPLDADDCLTVMSMEAFLHKGTLDTLSRYDEDVVIPADLAYLTKAVAAVSGRIGQLRGFGQKLISEARTAKLSKEADYYSKMLN